MAELLGLDQPPPTIPASPAMPNSASMHAKLVKADYHGSILTGELTKFCQLCLLNDQIVRQAKNPCLVGISGIVIHETENAFKLITKLNALKREGFDFISLWFRFSECRFLQWYQSKAAISLFRYLYTMPDPFYIVPRLGRRTPLRLLLA